jgi:hypothetical protein
MDTQEMLDSAKCDMEVVCQKRWQELDATDEEGIRYCGDCRQLVFYTETPTELRIAAERGLCVYIVPESKAQVERDLLLFQPPALTPERLRKIEAKALKRLKGPTVGVPILR